jgi:hypothetical protein
MELENEIMRITRYDGYTLYRYGLQRFHKHIYVQFYDEIHNLILREAHIVVQTTHPGGKKMCEDLKPLFFWVEMNKDIVSYVA